jgi:hypothetical protein
MLVAGVLLLLPAVESGLANLALITVALNHYAASFTPNIWSILQSASNPTPWGRHWES